MTFVVSCHLPSHFMRYALPGASPGDPTHDKVIWRRPDRQGRSGLEGLPRPARASTLKPKSVCLLFTILCLSPTLLTFSSVQFSSVTQSCPTLRDPMNRSTPGLPVHHQLPEFTQTQVHQVSDAIQPSHPLSSPSPLAPNPSLHQSLFQ